MEKREKNKFNVLTWDFNHDKVEHYDVLPYFRNAFKERVEKSKGKRIKKAMEKDPSMKKYYGVPSTFEEMREFVKDESLYMFWGRCEWEFIMHGWPVQKNDYKIDVHEQIMMNIDTITAILYSELVEKENVTIPSIWIKENRKNPPSEMSVVSFDAETGKCSSCTKYYDGDGKEIAEEEYKTLLK